MSPSHANDLLGKTLSYLRGVWLGGTSPSLPRLLPALGSVPTTLTETCGEKELIGLGNNLTEISLVGVRELIQRRTTLSWEKSLMQTLLGKPRHERMFVNSLVRAYWRQNVR